MSRAVSRAATTTTLRRGPETAGVLMGLTVAWNMYGFATGFFERAWRDDAPPIPVTPIAYGLNAAFAVCAPLVGGGRARRSATVLGVLMALWSAVGVLFVSREAEVAPNVPGVLGPGVAAVLGVVVAMLGARRG